MNVPQLRFDGFDREWESFTLGEISVVQTGPFGSQLHNADYVKEGTPIITVEHFGDNRIIHKNLPLVSEADRTRLEKYSLILGDIVFSRVGSIDRRVIVRKEEVGWLFSGRCLRVRVKNEITNDKYVSHYLGTKKCLNEIQSKAVGGTMASLNTAILSSINICVPTLEEQEEVARFFDLLQLKIEKQKEKIGNLEQFKKGMMQKIFSQELRFKDEDGGEFGEWEEKKLGQFLKIKHGRDQKKIEIPNGKFPILATGGTIGRTDTFIYDKESVLIGRKGTIDRPVFMDSPFWTVDTLFYSEIKENNYPKFLFYVFQNINWKLYNEASGVPSLSAKTIEAIKVTAPSFKEQKVIADYLSVIDRKIEKEKEKLMVVEEQKKGFMQGMFV